VETRDNAFVPLRFIDRQAYGVALDCLAQAGIDADDVRLEVSIQGDRRAVRVVLLATGAAWSRTVAPYDAMEYALHDWWHEVAADCQASLRKAWTAFLAHPDA
jgi:hypothetical protein